MNTNGADFYLQIKKQIEVKMSSIYKSSHTRHSYPFSNLSLNQNFSIKTAPLNSIGNNRPSSSYYSKPQKFERQEKQEKSQKINKNQTDLKAFKERYNINEHNMPISCLKLINTSSPKLFINLKELNMIEFPVLSYTISELCDFSKMIFQSNSERKLIGKSFNLNKLIHLIAENYLVTAYHNFTHAFSLLLLLFQAYNRCGKLRTMITEKQWFYVFIAALMHDLKHPGTTNAFEIKSRSQYAIQAQNVSVLEKMHLTDFWTILKKNSQVNFLQGYASYQSTNIKNIITKMVLSTDVAHHFKNLEEFKTITSKTELNQQQSLMVVEQLFHACDIGNPCLDFNNYISWGALVSFEFDSVAKKEKELGLEVTGFLKYHNLQKFYANQAGFCKGLVLPLWKELRTVLPGTAQMYENIISNIGELEERSQKEWDQ